MDPASVVWVPMKLDAYMNYDARMTVSANSQDRAYLAPIATPNFEGLKYSSGTVQHDIFDYHKDAPLMGTSDSTRREESRQGIYLHWSMPRMYRSGISTSGVAEEDVKTKLAFQGYPATIPNPGEAIFRPIPNRWLIWRSVRLPRAGAQIKARQGLSQEVSLSPGGEEWTIQGDFHVIHDIFALEADRVRKIDDIDFSEDLEVTTSPYLDPDIPLPNQGQTFLGKTTPLSQSYRNVTGSDTNAVDVTVSSAANPYFPDYQPQNSSVFSFFDDLSVLRHDNMDPMFSSGWKYSRALVSYSVVGFHTNQYKDPLWMDSERVAGSQTPSDRLKACGLNVTGTLGQEDADFLGKLYVPNQGEQNLRTLCFGHMFDLFWNQGISEEPLPETFVYPADQIQTSFATSQPLAVGTNPVDAVFGWLNATDDSTTPSSSDIKRDLIKIQTLVMEQNDNVDSQLQAQDLLATNNFIPLAAGARWHFQSESDDPNDKQPLVPTLDQISLLRQLNAAQSQLNALLREQQRLKRELFNTWWTYVSDRNTTSDRNALVTALAQKISALKDQISGNYIVDQQGAPHGVLSDLQKRVDDLKTQAGSVQPGADLPFHLQRDPTLLIAGMSSKWPADFDQPLDVRINPENDLATIPVDITIPRWRPFEISAIKANLPDELRQAIIDVVNEGEYNWMNRSCYNEPSKYYNNGDRQSQDGQDLNGWFPLFVEWEAEYYHIPFESWEFVPRGPDAKVSYGLKSTVNPADLKTQGDYRVLNGRCSILPQAGSILASTLSQVFSKINPDSQNLPAGTTKESLIAAAKQIDFVSSALTGFTDQLLTQCEGMHALPLNRAADGTISVLPDDPGKEIGLIDPSTYMMMADYTSKTPFASLVDIPADHSLYSPFKPCIHGQFRFTKLNIIDKFGQIVQGIKDYANPSDGMGPTQTALYPCLGESYSLDVNTDGTPRCVLPRAPGDKRNTFVQLPPSINQDARVNAMFVQEDDIQKPQKWVRAEEWDDPVRGWLLVNQANNSLQVFTPDGVFIREFSASNKNPLMRPFPIDDGFLPQEDPVLSALLTKLSDFVYLRSIFDSVARAAENIQPAPSTYSESMLSLLGRPLALTTFGVNLELADPPLTNRSTINTLSPSKNLLDYDFGLKVGDKDNVFDGLYGFFNIGSDITTNGVAGAVDWNHFYTYHNAPRDVPIATARVVPAQPMLTDITLKPFFPDPHSTDYPTACMANMLTFAGLVDPYTPVTFYTSLLPLQRLKLPDWVVDRGVKQICTFFRLGPILSPIDVPAYDPAQVLRRGYKLSDPSSLPLEIASIPIPAVGLGDWAWLQPHWDKDAITTNADGSTTVTPQTKYNLLAVDEMSTKPSYNPVPYTAVDGFLQQKRPFTNPQQFGNA